MGVHSGKYVAYYRCTAERQDHSGLGLDAQKLAVKRYLNGGNWQIVAEFVEIENGRKNPRPQLQAAIAAAKRARATLLVAKLDQLIRNVPFLTRLLESGIRFKAVEMPEADKRMFQLMAVLAEWEAGQISRRQKTALQAAKARGIQLGNPTNLAASNTARQEEGRCA